MPKNYKKYQDGMAAQSVAGINDKEAKGKEGYIMCDDCGAVYFKKHWHENIEALNKAEMTSFLKNTHIKSEICPACKLIKDHKYEGRVIIKNVPEKYSEELEGLIKNFCASAEDRDMMDRLIEINKSGSEWEILLTENQLTNKLAKKIGEVFEKANVRVYFIPEPSKTGEAVIEFAK